MTKTKPIQIEKIVKSFSGLKVLDGLSLSLESSKTHVLIGPSGCGKSTLLKILAGLVKPTSGKILLGDISLQDLSPQKKVETYGYVIQEGGLFPHLNGVENILLPARVHKMLNSETLSRYKDLIEMVSLSESLLKRFPREMSGGQRQRVSLVRALLLDAPLLLLDEPL